MIKKLLIMIVKTYQITPLHSHGMCRFTPSCSEYMIEALEEYGTIKGLIIGIKRIGRCHPFGKYGYDPLQRKEKK